MRYSGLLFAALAFGCFAGCIEDSTAPISKPSNTDNLPNTPQHTVNKPALDPNPGSTFNRGPGEGTTPRDVTAPDAVPNTNASTARDNTAVNERDQSSAAKTPFDQGNNSNDIKLTADIRQQIVNRSGMSINARNIKIVSADGKVTLRGPVENQAEKDLIEQMAKDTAGAANIDNQLEVVTKSE